MRQNAAKSRSDSSVGSLKFLAPLLEDVPRINIRAPLASALAARRE